MNGDQDILRALTFHISVLQGDQHPDDLGVSPWSCWKLCQHSCPLKVGLLKATNDILYQISLKVCI